MKEERKPQEYWKLRCKVEKKVEQIRTVSGTSLRNLLTFYEEYRAQAIEAGADSFLLKNIRREDLAMAIRAIHLFQATLLHNSSRSTSVKS